MKDCDILRGPSGRSKELVIILIGKEVSQDKGTWSFTIMFRSIITTNNIITNNKDSMITKIS